ncbi:DUF2628 domain-containing protein [Rhizobium helianthi]|uniref:DUF2628 domain-containing protein n=1 Tax=Rhizobium helianthi TaxID=1132695 RepID=A0ABW4M918_9HYPH
MKSFLVLLPPGGPTADHRTTRFIADKMVWTAFVFPGLWLLFQRCWLWGGLVFAAQIFAGRLMDWPGFFWAGFCAQLALGLLIGLEGRKMVIRRLMGKGWTLVDIVTAPDLTTAEQIYFSGPAGELWKPSVPSPDWSQRSPSGTVTTTNEPALGLFDMGRR